MLKAREILTFLGTFILCELGRLLDSLYTLKLLLRIGTAFVVVIITFRRQERKARHLLKAKYAFERMETP